MFVCRQEAEKGKKEQSFITRIFTLDYPTDSFAEETDAASKALWEAAKWGNY